MAGRPPRRGLVWALAASVALHVSTLVVGPARLGEPAVPPIDPLPDRIAVRLLPPPAAAPATARARPSPPLVGRDGPAPDAPPSSGAAMRAGPPPLPAPPLGPVAPVAPVATDGATDAQAAGIGASAGAARDGNAVPDPAQGPQGPPATPPVAAAAPPEPAVAKADEEKPEGPAAGTVRFPRSGRLDYAVTIGDPPAPVGRASYAWEATDSAYRLSLTAETTGLVGLLRRVRVVQTSEGRITAVGLRPDAFTMDRGPNARNEFARFDWTARQLTFGYPDAVQVAALADGTQDTLSLILQFAFVPIEQGRREVPLTTGRRLYVQAYERVAEEVVETPAGAWRAWHLRRVRAQPGAEGYDMWLSSDRPYLPVRIRWTDRNGRVTSATLDTVRIARD
jgi:hypothetical protein